MHLHWIFHRYLAPFWLSSVVSPHCNQSNISKMQLLILSFNFLKSFNNCLILSLILFTEFCIIYLLSHFPGSFLTTLTSPVLQPCYSTYLSLNEPNLNASNPSKWCSSAQEPSPNLHIYTDTYTYINAHIYIHRDTHTSTHTFATFSLNAFSLCHIHLLWKDISHWSQSPSD